MKEKYDHRLLLKHLPSDLRVFLEHIQVIFDMIYQLYIIIYHNKIFILVIIKLYIFVEFGICR